MPTLVRPAVLSDAQAIAAIGRESFTWAFGHLYRQDVLERYLESTYGQEKISASLAKPANLYFVAEADGRLTGFLKLKTGGPEPGRWQTQKLYIDPARIQGGAGKLLMAAGEEAMRARGATASWLVVYEGNDRALRFYEALGYRTTGSQRLVFEGIPIQFKVMEKWFQT